MKKIIKFNFKKIRKISLIFFLVFIFFLFLSNPILADIKDPLEFQPQIGIPGLVNKGETLTLKESNISYIAKMIRAFYNYGISIAGILAAIVLMAGGIIWLSSAGNSDKVSQAKKLIIGSITGLLLTFFAWLILNTINPYLVDFRIKDLKQIEKLEDICCQYSNSAEITTSIKCKANNGTALINNEDTIYALNSDGTRCYGIKVGCNLYKDCNNQVLYCFNSEKERKVFKSCNDKSVPLYEFKDKICKNFPECNNKIVSCKNVKDGDYCKSSNQNLIFCYCYNSISYLGFGEEGEPCGIQPGAFCSSKKCGELGQAGEKYKYGSGGRYCSVEKKLKCCYKEQ